MGARQLPQSDANQKLLFLIGSDQIQVYIFTPNDLIQKNRIIETLMQLSLLRSTVPQLYIAAPRLLGTTLDNRILSSHGIGLLLYDDRRIEETIKPAPVSALKQTQTVVSQKPDSTLLSELEILKSMYAQIQRSLEEVKNEFSSFKNNKTPIHVPVSDLESSPFDMIQQSQIQSFSVGVQGTSLPSFFSNNPWLDVLSKRGKSEVVSIAG
jgi:hypothetical protein